VRLQPSQIILVALAQTAPKITTRGSGILALVHHGGDTRPATALATTDRRTGRTKQRAEEPRRLRDQTLFSSVWAVKN